MTQKITLDEHGTPRFKENKIVSFLLENGGIDMNQIATLDVSKSDRRQFAQLIGYSTSGYSELSYTWDHPTAEYANYAAGQLLDGQKPKPYRLKRHNVENAIQAMAETAGSWEERCHGIMAALDIDFGGFTTEAPDIGSWWEVNNTRNQKRIQELEEALWKAESVLEDIAKGSGMFGVDNAVDLAWAMEHAGKAKDQVRNVRLKPTKGGLGVVGKWE